MRVLRRRAAAMSPREKHIAIISALCVVSVAFYYISNFLWATLILAVCCIVCYYHSGEPLPARLGLNPRAGLSVPAVLRRWFWGGEGTGVSVAARGPTKSGRNKTELRESEGHFRERLVETGIYRRETLNTDSFLFSPRDFLMGSYIVKHESPTADSGRPRAGRNPREQLREKLSRPNHAVYTPNRRLSFVGEPMNTVGRFTITPQRHYPLQQPGVSQVGVLPPVKWDGFRKKNILSPRNSSAVLSPVTVKIARPDHHSSPSLDHLSCTGLPRAPVDPCSRESVLKVLRESRKREVEDEDRSFTTEQKSKRRRNDSSGSAHSAFEPLLPNGTPSQQPGNLKRGMTSLAEDAIMKRSRTSSISSGSGVHAPRGTPGSMRNPIQSSYSSSLGLSQWKKRSAPSSPLSSPGSSRSQTPEAAAKRAKEDDGQSPSSASSVRSDRIAADKAPVTSKLTPVPKVPVTPSADSAGSGGKRKRKIQLVSIHRDDHISLPPPPELGYTITAKDLDEEKKAALSKIQKVLETPAPEPEKSVAPPATISTQPASSASSTAITLSSLLAAPLSVSSSAIPVINLDPSISVSTAPASPNPLLEALRMKISVPASSTSAVNTTTVSSTPVQPSGLTLKVSTPVVTPQLPPASQAQSSAGLEQPSAFTQVLSQVSKPSIGTVPAAGTGLFGLMSQISTPAASSASNPVTAPAPAISSASVSNTNPLLASGFKPIFSVTTTTSATSVPESKPPVQSFKPIFGAATAGAGFGQPPPYTTTNPASTASSSITSSMFGGSTSSTTVTPSLFTGMTNTPTGTASIGSITTTQPAAQPAVKSLFGNWSAPSTTSTSSASVQAPNTGSTFKFGTATTTTAAAAAPAAAAATTTSSSGNFTFGATQPDPQAANQKIFAFSQAAPSQNTATASFGGFSMPNTASTTAAAAPTQSTFSFGKSSFQTPATQSTFGSSMAPAAQTTFGSSVAPAAQTTFGSSVAPAAQTTFGSSMTPAAQTTFGSSMTPAAQTTFGSSVAPAAQTTFGSSMAPAAQTTFGSSMAPAAQTTFGSSMAPAAQTTFGSSVAPTTQTFGSSTTQTFGSSAAPATQTFGSSTTQTFGSSVAPTTQTFGSSAAPAAQSTFGSSAAAANTFNFGGGGGASSTSASNTAPPPFPFGSTAVTTATSFGTPAKPAFGASSTGFAFGGTTAPSAAPSAAPSFGAAAQTQSSSSSTFTFGSAAAQQVPSGPAQPASSGFNFGSGMPCPQFGTPAPNNPAPQMGSFNFGAAATDKPAFGTSTPSFGQSAAAAGPIPFGSPGTPVQGFNAVPFGSPATPSFSIGAGSKPSGARQRLQARRQHNRKK
ncbi:nuclear envelope pore membrane protein POM 121 [Cottoperca gobio]|uniref:Nuclear envelope pore membrane protein POM 121 n=1 Tax=Cottoperca gobio TaxID=56716 RepID=A0A6J2R332_COTGO|nr:nuclear envelope pore membrane protein POM 121C [Cottoperca gobio]